MLAEVAVLTAAAPLRCSQQPFQDFKPLMLGKSALTSRHARCHRRAFDSGKSPTDSQVPKPDAGQRSEESFDHPEPPAIPSLSGCLPSPESDCQRPLVTEHHQHECECARLLGCESGTGTKQCGRQRLGAIETQQCEAWKGRRGEGNRMHTPAYACSDESCCSLADEPCRDSCRVLRFVRAAHSHEA